METKTQSNRKPPKPPIIIGCGMADYEEFAKQPASLVLWCIMEPVYQLTASVTTAATFTTH